MFILHGCWVNNKKGDGDFYLWSESSLKVSKLKAPHVKSGEIHPFTLSSLEIENLLTSLDFPDIVMVKPRLIELVLPTIDNIPCASTSIISPKCYGDYSKAVLSSWKISSLVLPPFETFIWFLHRPESAETKNPEVLLSGDLLFWIRAAKFVLELILRQRYIPSVTQSGDKLSGTWKPVLSDAMDRERFRMLVESIPPSSRCSDNRLDGFELSAETVVSGFMTALLDSAVRTWVNNKEYEYLENKCFYREDVFSRWIKSLCSEEAHIKIDKYQKNVLLEHVGPWSEVLYATDKKVSWITCFKLEEPPEITDDWTLSFHLQFAEDRSLVIPIEYLWENDEKISGIVKEDINQLQERIIADIEKASKLFPPLETSLESRKPTACVFNMATAYNFLVEGACLLEESGYNVIIPAWWQDRERKFSVGFKMKTGGTEEKFFTLNTMLNFTWEIALGDEKISFEEFNKISQLKIPLVKFRGKWIEVNSKSIQTILKMIKDAEGKGIPLATAMKMKLSGQEQDIGITECTFVDWMEMIISGEDNFSSVPVPEGFIGKLRPYQERGFSWLNYITEKGFGACLADDMGLGKTIQYLTLIMHCMEKKNIGNPVLLLCPTSIVDNWRREVERFTPGLKYMIHHGIRRLTGQAFVDAANQHNLVISTYSLALRDKEIMLQVDWSGTVLDEAQGIKNPLAKQSRAIREVAKGYRIALTGTPVENRLSELWSIMEFLNPGYLGGLSEFRRNFAIPIELYKDETTLERLKKIVQPFILRRMKTDRNIIKDLPSKFETKIFCNLSMEQATLYKATVDDLMEKMEDSEGIQRKGIILSLLTKLKQICNHPALFLKDSSRTGERSEKLNRLTQMVEEILLEDNRMLIFTQYVEMGNILQEYLQSRFAREALFLHGGLQRSTRDLMIKRFQEDKNGPPIFILSTRAGGFGLNLTKANYVFHFDRWWNPAVENQATDRAYRIGQERNVMVYKFVCSGTLEEKIDKLLEQKKGLADNIMGTGEAWLTELSTDKLKEIFAIRMDEAVIQSEKEEP